jgi:O-antigen/teichoic acid export membrane protein
MGDKVTATTLMGRTLSGVAWGVVGTTVGKLAAFGAQLFLGWLLGPEDFALYAIALAAYAMVSGLMNGGTQRILIQRSPHYDELAFVALKLAFVFNLSIMAVLVGAAIPVSRWFDAPVLQPMLVVMGLAAVIASPAPVLRAKLAGDLRFRTVQGLGMVSSVARQVSSVAFALVGLGPLSFVLPMLVIAIIDDLLAWRAVGRLPTPRRFDRQVAMGILRDSRWIMASTFAAAMIQNGSNLAVGLFADKTTLGVYFFALQLTFAVAQLFGGALQSVMMPTLVHIAEDQVRRHQVFLRAVYPTALAASAMAVALVFALPPLVHWLWAGKWDEAIAVSQTLSLCLPAVMVSWIGRAGIEASGGWATFTALSVVEGVGVIGAGAVGAMVGGLLPIAAAVAAVKAAAGFAQVLVASKRLGGRAIDAAAPLLRAYAVGGAALVTGQAVSAYSALPNVSPIAVVAGATAFGAFGRVFCRRGLGELGTMVRYSLGRPQDEAQ